MLKIKWLLFSFLTINVYSQENFVTTASSIKEVKIYSSGGFVRHSFSANLLPGKNYVIVNDFGKNGVTDISNFKTDKKINILRYEYYNNNLSFYSSKLKSSNKNDQINDSINYYKKLNEVLDQDLVLTKNSLDIIRKNQTLENPSPAEISKLIDYNKVNLKDLFKEETNLQTKINDNKSRISKLENKRYESSQEVNNRMNNTIVLLVNSDKKQHVNFDVNQLIQDAYWAPSYTIKSNGITTPLKISYNAKIRQNTGLELRNIPIKLINGSFNGEDKPYELDRWFLRTERDYYVSNQAFQKPQIDKSVKNVSVQEVAIMGRPRFSQKTMKTEISLDKNVVIPSDVQVTEELNQFEVSTTYKYYSTPKTEIKTFLLASIKDYSKYNFLPGNADIYMDDTQTGTVMIDANQLSNEMMISLGSDPNVLTKRELIKKETKSLGDKEKTEFYAYEITVKNNKNTAINLELKDQVPLSTDEKIKIQITNPDKADYDPSSGFLIWNLNIKPNETKKISFGFNVTLPKELVILDIK